MNLWARLFPKREEPKPKKGLVCCDCGGSIHKHHRYKIVTARHLDCHDPKRVGQTHITE